MDYVHVNKFYQETMDWLAESKAEHEAAMAAYEERKKEVTKNREDSTMRLDIISAKLQKFRGQLDNIVEGIAKLEKN